jgi:hypothetical protein
MPDACEFGDLNCDGQTNGLDIDAFVIAITDPIAYSQRFPTCDILQGDVDLSGTADLTDMQPFVELLIEP